LFFIPTNIYSIPNQNNVPKTKSSL